MVSYDGKIEQSRDFGVKKDKTKMILDEASNWENNTQV